MQPTKNAYELEVEANIRKNNERFEAMGLSGSVANFIALSDEKQVRQRRGRAQGKQAPKRVVQCRNTRQQPVQVLPLRKSRSDSEDGSRDPSYQAETSVTSESSDTDNEGEEELDKDPESPRSEGQKGQDQPACQPTPGRY